MENPIVSNISEYLTIIRGLFKLESKLIIYRGQPSDKPLLPKIARNIVKGKTIIDISDIKFLDVEKHLFDEFKRRCFQYLSRTPDNDYDWLALAQHYGLHTRLLDWTENALAALWFAVREEDNLSNAIVWAFEVATDDIVVPSKELKPFQGSNTKVFKPNQITGRIISQSGWFTLHKYINPNNLFIPLDKISRLKSQLKKIIISKDTLNDLRFELNICGVNEASLYPDLDGVCRFLNWETINKFLPYGSFIEYSLNDLAKKLGK
jgi:hypothetical protein